MGGLMKYLAAMGPKGEELLAKLGSAGEGALGMAKSHPEVTAGLGGAAAGYGASELMDEDSDDSDADDLDEDSVLKKYMRH